MSRRRVSDLMKGGLRKFQSEMPKDKNGSCRFQEEGSTPFTTPSPVPNESPASREGSPGCVNRNGVEQEAPTGVAKLPPDDPMNWVNPSFRDQAFFDEYVAILKEIRDSNLVTGDEEN